MSTASKHWQEVAEESILDYFRTHTEPFHSDDLWHIVPDEYRGVISLAVMALVNKKLIVGCGYRKSAIPSRKRSPSQEYRLTELGRDRIAGVSAGASANRASLASGGTVEVSTASADPGECSGEDTTGSPSEPARLPGLDGPIPSAYNPYSEAA